MRERGLLLGSASSLVAVMTEPSSAVNPDRPAVILFNAGVIHRIGPNRVYVRIARALAAAGFLALRFDLSGRGDSDVRPDTTSYAEGDLREAQEVMTYLEQAKGVRTFVLMGICSGAGLAYQAACVDPRVVGIALIEAYAFPTTGFYLRYYARRALRARSWLNTFAGRNPLGRRLRRAWWKERAASPEAVDDWMGAGADVALAAPAIPPKEIVTKTLRDLIARSVHLCLVFSGGGDGGASGYNYRGQFVDAFPNVDFKGRLRVEYVANADHTFTLLANQKTLVSIILDWMRKVFPSAPTQG